MQHFFVAPDQVQDGFIYVDGSDVNHMKNVLRMKPGEELTVSDGNNLKYYCKIEEYREKQAVLRIEASEPIDTELDSKIYLFQGLPKQDKMELIVQKAVELGVHEVIPVVTRRVVVKLDARKAAKKVERWQSIAEGASKQAGRGYVPGIASVMGYEEALQYAGNLDILLIPYELAEGMDAARKVIETIRPGQSIGIFIGPEGGFEKEEVKKALSAGAKEITLGKRILRTETAGLATLAVLMFHLEDQ